MLRTKVELLQFGVEVCGYKDLKGSYRYFAKKFNESMEISEFNNTATIAELLQFNAKGGCSKKEFKDWCANKMSEVLAEALATTVDRVEFNPQLIAPKPKSTTATTTTAETAVPTESVQITDESIMDILGIL